MLRKQTLYSEQLWPSWFKEISTRCKTPTIFLHGIMGSELYDYREKDTVWIDLGIWHEVDDLVVDALTPEGLIDSEGQDIYARSTVRPPIITAPYTDLMSNVPVGRFNFDWRESIPLESIRLEVFLDQYFQNSERMSFVTHSMGGCFLLWLLISTNKYDERIDKIVFCAPPFHGALKPMRVIEDGNGTPADLLIHNSTLQQAAATMPGLLDMLVAPPDNWITQIKVSPGNTINLLQPVRGDRNDLYIPASWTNTYNREIFTQGLNFARDYHSRKFTGIDDVIHRLGDKISIICGLNGKTDFCAQWHSDIQHWTLHSFSAGIEIPNGKVSNGDGTVLFQSSYLSGLSHGQYWAYTPAEREDTHGGLVDIAEVGESINLLLAGKTPEKLQPFSEFIQKIHWDYENIGSADPAPDQFLDYHERERMRGKIPISDWGADLNPNGDALIFKTTRDAALRVIAGIDSLSKAAQRIGQKPEFLEQHIKSTLFPVLFG